MKNLSWVFKIDRSEGNKMFYAGQPFKPKKWSNSELNDLIQGKKKIKDFPVKKIIGHDHSEVIKELIVRSVSQGFTELKEEDKP